MQDHAKAIKLWTLAAKLGSSKAHFNLVNEYHKGGCLKKARFHYEPAAMAGNEAARCKIGAMEAQNGNMELSNIGRLQHQLGVSNP
jgi:TPR repeat protein